VFEAVFEVPVADHWLAKKEALAVAIRHVHGPGSFPSRDRWIQCLIG